MDNAAIARILADIAALLEIRGKHPFKVRACRQAAETIAGAAGRIAHLDEARLLALPGIGRDLAARIGEIARTGSSTYRNELLGELPPTILDLLRLQGIGPKTVAGFFHELGVGSLDALEKAATGAAFGVCAA